MEFSFNRATDIIKHLGRRISQIFFFSVSIEDSFLGLNTTIPFK